MQGPFGGPFLWPVVWGWQAVGHVGGWEDAPVSGGCALWRIVAGRTAFGQDRDRPRQKQGPGLVIGQMLPGLGGGLEGMVAELEEGTVPSWSACCQGTVPFSILLLVTGRESVYHNKASPLEMLLAFLPVVTG